MSEIPKEVLKATKKLTGDVAPILDLWSELTAAGAVVTFCPEQLSRTGEGDKNAAADWHYDQKELKVFYKANTKCHHVFHELLHLKVALAGMKAARALPDATERMSQIIQEVNNDIDHMYVVPAELAVYPEAQKYWVKQFEGNLKTLVFKAPTADNMLSNKYRLLLTWPTISRAMPNHVLTQKFKDALFRFNFADSAKLGTDALDLKPYSKEWVMDVLQMSLFGTQFPFNEQATFHDWMDYSNVYIPYRPTQKIA